jgi:hypothetical protein
MHQQRAHGDDATRLHCALDRLYALGEVMDSRVAEHSMDVRSGKDAQRSIVRSRVVQVNSQCDHLIQHVAEGTGIRDASLQ